MNYNLRNGKKQKTSHLNWDNMVSASAIRNYMLNDPCIDYYKMYITKEKLDLHTEYILNNGCMFEKQIIDNISQKHNIIKVGEKYDANNIDKYNETIELMKIGVPIIYQGVLHNYTDNTYGMPDLMVRSDYINKLMGYHVISHTEANLGSSKLNVNWHYKIIDIKGSIIPTKSLKNIVTNNSMMPYIGQLYIYTRDLNNILGTNMNSNYILGRKYTNVSMNKLGLVLFDNNISTKVKNACDWIRDLRKNGNNWNLLPVPSRVELYPNMKNHDNTYVNIKKKYAEMYKEITSVWNCSYEARTIAHSKNILSYMDPKCTSLAMGFKPSKTSETIDKILDVNRQTDDIMIPNKITFDRENWDTNDMEVYMDYETVMVNNINYIFMIGIGYHINNKFYYKEFVMKELNDMEELNTFMEFHSYVLNLAKTVNKEKIRLFHWSCAEPCLYTKFKIKHKLNNMYEMNMCFYDLSKVFINNIVIKGALSYSLKSIARALYNAGYIKTIWPTDSTCMDGLNALILAINYYNNNDSVIMKDIIRYNEVDCKTLSEIHILIKSLK